MRSRKRKTRSEWLAGGFLRGRRPLPGSELFVHDQRRGPRGQHLKGLQELDHGIAVILGEILKRHPFGQRLSVVGEHSLSQGSEEPVMEEWRLVSRSPQPLG